MIENGIWDLEDKISFTRMSLANDREKTADSLRELIPVELRKKLTLFSVDDPFESSFALLYLLDSDSDVPWLYYGSVSVAYTTVDQLPFGAKELNAPNKEKLPDEMIKLLYSHKYRGNRCGDMIDSEGEPVYRTKDTNLSQILYQNGNLVFPRIADATGIERFIALVSPTSKEETNALKLLVGCLSAVGFRGTGLMEWIHQQPDEEDEEEKSISEDSDSGSSESQDGDSNSSSDESQDGDSDSGNSESQDGNSNSDSGKSQVGDSDSGSSESQDGDSDSGSSESQDGDSGSGSDESQEDGTGSPKNNTPSGEQNQSMSSAEAEQLWREVTHRIQVDAETFSHQQGSHAGGMMQNLKEVNREKYDYTSFLKKFAVLSEAMKINEDEFDYVFYTCELQLYENMPLIEPLEYKEVRRIREFVIAIDTSGSVSGELVQRFIQKTYNILQSIESFFSKINVHIIQCDADIQEDKKITCREEFDEYLKTMKIALSVALRNFPS